MWLSGHQPGLKLGMPARWVLMKRRVLYIIIITGKPSFFMALSTGIYVKLAICTLCFVHCHALTVIHNVPPTKNIFSGILESACLSICVAIPPCVYMSVCVQKPTFCQMTGGGIKSHSVTAIVLNVINSLPSDKIQVSPRLKAFADHCIPRCK